MSGIGITADGPRIRLTLMSGTDPKQTLAQILYMSATERRADLPLIGR